MSSSTALRHTAANSKWIGISQAGKVGLQLLSALVLARLLDPSDYGLYAMVAIVVTLAGMFRDLGTAQALIQAKVLNDDITLSIFWLNIAIGLALTTIVSLLAKPISLVFNEPKLVSILILCSISFPLAASGAVHQALMERDNKFKILARIELSSHAAGLITAISLAWHGFSVYSLAWQGIVTAASTALQLWLASKWRPKALRLHRDALSLARFSGNLTGFSLVNYCARNADTFIIGRVLGTQALGAYSLAYKLMMFPLQNMTFVAGRALMPVMSRLQEDLNAMSQLYIQTLRAIAAITAPLMITVWLLREEVVSILFGNQWGTVSNILLWLAPLGFLQSIMSTAGTVFMARGKTDWLFRLGLFTTTTQIISFIYGVRGGLESLLLWYVISNLINIIPIGWLVGSLLNLSKLKLIYAILPSTISATCMAAILELIRALLPENLHPITKALSALAPAVLAYILVIRLVFKQNLPRFRA